MSTTSPFASDTPWSQWKRHYADNLTTATVAALLEAGSFLLFLYMFIQTPQRLFAVVGGALILFWLFNVGISALNAYLLSHPKIAPTMEV
jgi:hypothetical protein